MSKETVVAGVARQPRMKDVAERCGVSIKSVSRVVNGLPGTSPATTARILTAIEELGFHRNQLASDLRQIGRSSTIGVVIEDVSNPFYGTMTRAIEKCARERGLMVLSVSSDEDPAREHQLIRELVGRRVAGLIIVTATSDNTYLIPDLERGLPVVFADRPGNGVRCDEILLDNLHGAREAVDHLLKRGHRRIGVIADHDHVYTAHERVAGYREALTAGGVEVDAALVRMGRHTAEEAASAVHELMALGEPPTALFTTNNRSTVGALRAVSGRDAPPDLVGFDDFELAELLDPPVSVVAHDPSELGRRAAERLISRIEGDESPPTREMLASRLLVRGPGTGREVAFAHQGAI